MPKYAAHGAYTYAATPTWGVAQEGDGTHGSGAVLAAVRTGNAVSSVTITNGGSGYSTNTSITFTGGGGSGATATITSVSATGAITGISVGAGGSGYTSDPTVNLAPGNAVSATVSVDLSAYTAAAGNTIAIGGATLTCVASGAGNNQFNAGTGTTLIDNIVTAINRTANTVTISALASGWWTPKIQDAVFARRNGNNLEIMTRAGSATYNANASFKVVTTGFTGGSQIDAQFSGGAGGYWGWLSNSSATWPSSIAAYSYGPFHNSKVLAGVFADEETLEVRGGGTLNIGPDTTAFDLNTTRNNNFIFDDGTVWPGYTTAFTINYNRAGWVQNFVAAASKRLVISARQRGGLAIVGSASASGSFIVNAGNYGSFVIENAYFESNHASSPIVSTTISSDAAHQRFVNCDWVFKANGMPTVFSAGGYNGTTVLFEGCTFTWTNYTGGGNAITGALTNMYSGHCLGYVGCTFSSSGGKPILFGSKPNVGNWLAFAQDCYGDVEINGTTLGLVDAARGTLSAESAGQVVMQNIGAKQAFRIEDTRAIVDWADGLGYPTYNSLLRDGTPWSYRVLWSAGVGIFQYARNTLLSLTKESPLADGIKTITLELLVDNAGGNAANVKNDALVIFVAYTDDTGVARVEQSFNFGDTAAALATSSASWTLNSYTGHVARKISVTTQHAVKQWTQVGVSLCAYKRAPVLQNLFVNPEVEITAV